MKLKRILNLIAAVVVLVGLAPMAGPVLANNHPAAPTGQYVPGEVVVLFEDSVAAVGAPAQALAGQVGAQVVKSYANMALLSFDPSTAVDGVAARLASNSGVRYAGPNYIKSIPTVHAGTRSQLSVIQRTTSGGGSLSVKVEDLLAMRSIKRVGARTMVVPTYPNDEFNNWGNLWIGHDIVWSDKLLAPTVCVLDSGVDATHPDLKRQVLNGYDFVNADKLPNDDNGHGTHVAGTIVAKSNNKIGPAGISNGKVLAVKVIGAQGWGTTFDIDAGIRYCADNKTVKVINMSLGSNIPDPADYDALTYAVGKGKLFAVAAGNESTSLRDYPAAWGSVTTCASGDPQDFGAYPATGCPVDEDNTIHTSILSVGAESNQTVWVDTNGNGANNLPADSGEYYAGGCANEFSNYGKWVEIVAPGQDIYSTLPASYPFYLNYNFGYLPGYDYLTGTSMATPHVAAAAARVWAQHPTWIAAQIAAALVSDSGSNPLKLAIDPHVSDPTAGYFSSGYATDGVPYCWPNATAPFTADEDMSASRELNLAKAMGRGAIESSAWDSISGGPILGAALSAVSGGKVRDTSRTAIAVDAYPSADLINLPVGSYDLGLNAKGYTIGLQTTSSGIPVTAGEFTADLDPVKGTYKTLAIVPPNNGNFSVVTQWSMQSASDIDTYLWLPATQSTVVGPDQNEKAVPSAIPLPTSVVGTLNAEPFARYMHYDDKDGRTWETTVIRKLVKKAYYTGDYQVFLTDNDPNGAGLNSALPTVSVWFGGKKLGTVTHGAQLCTTGQSWWNALKLNGATVTSVDACGASGIWPYTP